MVRIELSCTGTGVSPDEVRQHLLAIASYIEGEDSPRIDVVAGAVRGLLNATAPRSAGDLKKFMLPEIQGFQKGLDDLVARLKKVVQTLNPQDEAYPILAPTLKDWEQLKDDLEMQLEDFENIPI